MIDYKKVLESGKKPQYIKDAEDYSDSIKIHTKGGELLQKKLAQINSYENSDQWTLRKKFAISNKFVVDELLKPVENIWKARGGSKLLEVGSTNIKSELEKLLSDVYGYVKNTWTDAFVTDPNGLIKVGYNDFDGLILDYISTNDIYDIEILNKKVQEVLIYEGTQEIDDRIIEHYTLYDSDFTVLISKEGETINETIVPNPLDEVPFVLISTISDIDTDYYISPIDTQIELLLSLIHI